MAAKVVIYTDGGVSPNPGKGGYGVVFLTKVDDVIHERAVSGFVPEATNNVMELSAILVALSGIKKKDVEVILYTDSQYAIGVSTGAWKAKKNLELVKEIKTLVAQFPNLRFKWTKGHAGGINDEAHQLVTQAIANEKGSDNRRTRTNVQGLEL